METNGIPPPSDLVWSLGLQFASDFRRGGFPGARRCHEGADAVPLRVLEAIAEARVRASPSQALLLTEKERSAQNRRRARIEAYSQSGTLKQWRPECLNQTPYFGSYGF